MEKQNIDSGGVDEIKAIETLKQTIKRISDVEFHKVLHETTNNPVWVGSKRKRGVGFSFYQPHNFRRWFKFSKVGFVWNFYNQPTLTHIGITHKWLNYDSEHWYDNFFGCSVRVRKNSIEVTNKNPKWSLIEHGKDNCLDIIDEREKECVSVLKNFIEFAGGNSDFVVFNKDSEDKIRGNSVTECLPLDMRFRTPIVKKEYNEKVIEYPGKDSPVHVANFFENMAIIDKGSEILEGISDIRKEIFRLNPLVALKSKVKCCQDVIDNKDLVLLLSHKEKRDLSRWLFEELSIHA